MSITQLVILDSNSSDCPKWSSVRVAWRAAGKRTHMTAINSKLEFKWATAWTIHSKIIVRNYERMMRWFFWWSIGESEQIRQQLVSWLPTLSNFCSFLRVANPPNRKAHPNTNSMLDRTDPKSDSCTTRTILFRSANTHMIVSVVFPNVAFKRPPTAKKERSALNVVSAPEFENDYRKCCTVTQESLQREQALRLDAVSEAIQLHLCGFKHFCETKEFRSTCRTCKIRQLSDVKEIVISNDSDKSYTWKELPCLFH